MSYLKKWSLIVFFLFCVASHCGFAAAPLSTIKLHTEDLQEVADIVFPQVVSKINSDPYPLGGFSGVEVGISREQNSQKPVEQAERIGPKTVITLGKGMYYHIDGYLSFSPGESSQFGGLLRWSFYQNPRLPLLLSIQGYGGAGSITDDIFAQTYGANLMATLYQKYFSIYTGIGPSRGVVRFFGGDSGSTETKDTYVKTVASSQFILGASFYIDKISVGAQVDSFKETSIYTLRISTRM